MTDLSRALGWAAGAAVLSACATTYAPPTEAAPEAWRGASGMAVDGPVRTTDGATAKGGTIASWDVTARRAGRLAEPVTVEATYGGQITFPAGSQAVAHQFSLVQTGGYSGTQNLNAANDPIEWCLRDAKDDLYCAFWEGPDRARYIGFGGTLLAPTPTLTTGPVGPVPFIEETEGEGPEGEVLVRVHDFGVNGVRLVSDVRAEDGERRLTNDYRRYRKEPAVFGVYGGRVRIAPDASEGEKPSAVEVAFLRPPAPQAADASAVIALLAVIDAQRAAAEEAGDADKAARLSEMATRLRGALGAPGAEAGVEAGAKADSP